MGWGAGTGGGAGWGQDTGGGAGWGVRRQTQEEEQGGGEGGRYREEGVGGQVQEAEWGGGVGRDKPLKREAEGAQAG